MGTKKKFYLVLTSQKELVTLCILGPGWARGYRSGILKQPLVIPFKLTLPITMTESRD